MIRRWPRYVALIIQGWCGAGGIAIAVPAGGPWGGRQQAGWGRGNRMREKTILLISSDECGWTDLRAALQSMANVRVVGDTRSAVEACHLATIFAPAVIIAAATVEGAPARPLLFALHQTLPTSKIIVFAARLEPDGGVPLNEAGITGYLRWSDLSSEALRPCLAAMIAGDVIVASPAVVQALIAAPYQRSLGDRQQAILRRLAEGLTPQEWKVLPLLAREDLTTYKQIGAALDIASETVRSHMKRIAEKFGVAGQRPVVVAAARRRGLLSPPDASPPTRQALPSVPAHRDHGYPPPGKKITRTWG